MAHRIVSGRHGPSPTPVLIGRESERVFLREELATALGGRGRLVLIGGEAGIGKTTLALDLVAGAAARGARVLTGACYDLTNAPPYGPWLDLFSQYRRTEHDPPPPTAFRGGRLRGTIADQAALFSEIRAFVAALAGTRPAVILLEDLHWADPASIELICFLGAQVARWPLLFMLTYRLDELTRHHPFGQRLPALLRASEGLWLDLKRLSPAELRELVSTYYRLAPVDESRLVSYLVSHAEGNPLFANELLRALRDAEVLRQVGDRWVLGEINQLVMPALLTQVIERRIARLGEAIRGPLAIAAIIGQEVSLELWSAIAGLDDETVFGIVEQAVEAHLLESEPDGRRVRFGHALTREVLYNSVLPPRRRLWHRRLADYLMTRPEADPELVAAHLERAGDARAAEWLIRAGDLAQRAYALLTAAERFRAAAGLLEAAGGQERNRALLYYRLARLQRFSNPRGGIADLDAAELLADQAGDPVLTAEIRYSRGLLRCYADDFGRGIPEMDRGIAALESFPEEVTRAAGLVNVWLADALPARPVEPFPADEIAAPAVAVGGIHHRRGGHPWFRAVQGRLTAAQRTGEAFIAHVGSAEAIGSLLGSSAAHAHQGLGIVAAGQGRPVDARAHFAEARDRYRRLNHHAAIAFSILTELRDVVIPFYGDVPDARHQLATEAAAELRRAGGALVPGLSPDLAHLACYALDGQWAEADALLQELPSPQNCFLRREITATTATLARHRGNSEVAWDTIAAVLTAGPATEPGSCKFQEALFLQRLAVDLALDAGDLPAAHAWLEAHHRWLAWNDAVLGRADGQLAWAGYHHRCGDHDRARASVMTALALASEPRQPLLLLATHRFLGQLLTAAGRADEAETHLQAALALAESCAVPVERALTWIALAEVRLAHARPADAAALLAQAKPLCSSLGAQPALARIAALEARLAGSRPNGKPPFGLTARECEVLRLVAQGMTDAAVAEHLYISPRTVGRHLHSIYTKLDLPSRAAATRFAIEHDLA